MEPSWREKIGFRLACKKGDYEKVDSLLNKFPSLVDSKGILGNINLFIYLKNMHDNNIYV